MNKSKAAKLQYLLINQLLKKGSVELLLPDGVTIEIGITQEDQFGDLHREDDYCYVVASRDGKSVMLDSFNLGLCYEPEEHTIICEDETIDEDGRLILSLDVV
jgi:beta-galactosidase beta subunit